MRTGRLSRILMAPFRLLVRVFVAALTFVLARDRGAVGRSRPEGVTSGSMDVDERAKVAEAEARAGEADARAAEAHARAAEAHRAAGGDGQGDPERAVEHRPPEDIGAEHPLPDPDACRRILEKIRSIFGFKR